MNQSREGLDAITLLAIEEAMLLSQWQLRLESINKCVCFSPNQKNVESW